ncbi:MAG: hypothetical protein WKG00_15600 [Polyangiaceae bacterium]
MQTHPKWWDDNKTSSWERTKDAMKRDWEQTKHDFGGKAPDLDQDVNDTVKQAVGKQAIPPDGVSNADGGPNTPGWDHAEPALRYGWGAADHYKDHGQWDAGLEGKLSEEWNDLKTGRTWDEIKSTVRRGWDKSRSKTG